MPLRLFNTLSAKIEDFRPLQDNQVRMYACGPTVYDYGHIGNFRTFIAVDILRRYLRQSGFKVRHVMNITDVDDKIIRNSAQAGVGVQQYTAKYEKAFLEDAAALNIEQPELVRATEHIDEMAEFIARLVEKGLAYRTDDGSYYFRIAKFPAYGKLSKRDFAGMEDGARVDVDEYEKDNARDFALWKAPKPGEASWQSKIGPGRPGWHIECSVMSMLKLGKSLGNFYTLRDLVLKGHRPSSIRYLLASVPYRNQLNFTDDGLQQAAASVERLRNFQAPLATGKFSDGSNPHMAKLASDTRDRITAALDDDLNTAQAQGAIFDMVRSANASIDSGAMQKADASALLATLDQFDEIF